MLNPPPWIDRAESGCIILVRQKELLRTVPNTKTAKKQLQVSRRNQARNYHYRTILKSAVKSARVAITAGTDRDQAQAALDKAVKTLHRSATRNLIKRQNASRRASRLAIAFNKSFNQVAAVDPVQTDSVPAEAAE
jgi:small subunit ribosomal protein S20